MDDLQDGEREEVHQLALPMIVPVQGDVPPVPARIVNEWFYCPRLAILEWSEKEWADTAETLEGRQIHEVVDRGGGALDEGSGIVRSLSLTSEKLGLTGVIDLAKTAGDGVTIVETKRGRRPKTPLGAHDPELTQVCCQTMLLEDAGIRVNESRIYFAGSKEHVIVEVDDDLRRRTLSSLSEIREAAASGRLPPPLVDSPKCVHCSLAGICLPDEIAFFKHDIRPRPLAPAHDLRLPVYVQKPGARVSKAGESLVIEHDNEKTTVGLPDVSSLNLMGPISVTTPAMHALLRAGIPVMYASSGGWVLGFAHTFSSRNALLRIAQHAAAGDAERSLAFSKGLVSAKIRNSRTILMRNSRDKSISSNHEIMLNYARRARSATSAGELLGLEGQAAHLYFRSFESMFSRADGRIPPFQFETRSRRPPADPINALLSYTYSLLTKTFIGVALTVGLDPYVGLFHRPRHGKPSLALDIMEPFRPILADSVVIQILNQEEIKISDFIITSHGTSLRESGRKKVIAAYERRLDLETTHSSFQYRVTMRRLLEVEVRLFARWLRREIAFVPHHLVR